MPTQRGGSVYGLATAVALEFNKHLSDGGYAISHCAGLGYIYRTLGYGFCVPMETQVQLEYRDIESFQEESDKKVSLRAADISDRSSHSLWYNRHTTRFDLAAERTKEQWGYLLGDSLKTGRAADTYIIESDEGPVGYCRVSSKTFGEDALALGECSDLDFDHFPGLFACLSDVGKERNKPCVRINLGPTHPAVLAARDAGARESPGYSWQFWQFRISGPAAFLISIRPVLDTRLAKSSFSDFSGVLIIDLYRHAATVSIADGKIRDVSRTTTRTGTRVAALSTFRRISSRHLSSVKEPSTSAA